MLSDSVSQLFLEVQTLLMELFYNELSKTRRFDYLVLRFVLLLLTRKHATSRQNGAARSELLAFHQFLLDDPSSLLLSVLI